MTTKLVIPPEAFLPEHLFEDSRHFVELASEFDKTDQHKARTYIRASIVTAFAGLEAAVNLLLYLLDEFNDLELAEAAFVREKRVELAEDGHLVIRGQKFPSLEQKIKFLHCRREGGPIAKDSPIWNSFLEAVKLRNTLVHPKPGQVSYSDIDGVRCQGVPNSNHRAIADARRTRH